MRISVTGPESSGKTTLVLELAAHFGVVPILEYAREYLHQKGSVYDLNDLDAIADGQLEQLLLSQESIKISDSDFLTIKVWSEYKYNQVSERILHHYKNQTFNLTILCSPDIPWEEDPLRENPNDRDVLFDLYKKDLDATGRNYIILNGSREQRFSCALERIEELLKNN